MSNWKHTSQNEWVNKDDNLKINVQQYSNGYKAKITNLNTHTVEDIVLYHTGQTHKEVLIKVTKYIRKN